MSKQATDGSPGARAAQRGDRRERRRLVQRRQGGELLERRDDGVVDDHGIDESRAAVDHAVADRIGLAELLERRVDVVAGRRDPSRRAARRRRRATSA